ncbi:MAG: GAF domain-containing protein [Nitriliruptoraceae bacterium]
MAARPDAGSTATNTERSGPLADALAELERGTRDRWLVALILVLAVVATLSWVVVDEVDIAVVPATIGGFLVVTIVYGVNVAFQERRGRRVIRALVAEGERRAALTGRVAALESLDIATGSVHEAEELPEVVERILAAARTLVGASGGIVLLRGDQGLLVAAAEGREMPARGEPVSPTHLATATLERGEALRGGRGAPWGTPDGPSQVAAPLRLGDRVVGVLLLERAAAERPFTATEESVLERFGRHAARALRTTSHLDSERQRAAGAGTEGAGRLAAAGDLAVDLGRAVAAAQAFLATLRDRDDELTPSRRAGLVDDASRALAQVDELRAALARTVPVNGSRTPSEMALSSGSQPSPPPPPVLADLAQSVREAAITARGLALAQGQARRLVVQAAGPAPVAAPPAELRRLAFSLVAVAIEASPLGSDVEVSVDGRSGGWALTVLYGGPPLGADAEPLAGVHRLARSLGGTLDPTTDRAPARLTVLLTSTATRPSPPG